MDFYSDETYISWLDQLAENDYVIIDDFISEELFGIISTWYEGVVDILWICSILYV